MKIISGKIILAIDLNYNECLMTTPIMDFFINSHKINKPDKYK